MRRGLPILLATVLVAGCAGGQPSSPQPVASGPAAVSPAGPKVISLAINEDPPSFWDAATGGIGNAGGRALLPGVNQFLVVTGADGTPHLRLLAELPSVERGTWRLFPDGSMETVWKLRSGVVWHDGTPFTTEDVAFSVEVNRDPEVPNSNRSAVSPITRVEMPDATTAVVSWAQVYPFADRLSDREFVPMARHLLEKAYRESKDTLLLQPHWNVDYVGLGPYRVGRWERGSSLELLAFDAYFLGRPRIDSIRVHFITDQNTLVTNLLARSIRTALPPGGADFEPMLLVKREWEAAGYGTALMSSEFWTFIDPQKARNPQPADLADSRVRRALLLALDRHQYVEAIHGEFGTVGDSWLHPNSPRYQQLGDALTRYTQDTVRASQLFREAGWERGADGVLEKGGQRFVTRIRGSDDERPAAILADQWKAVGVRAEYEPLPPQAQRDRMIRATTTGVDITSNPMAPYAVQRRFATISIPTPENNWIGVNRGAYSSPEWDALADRFLRTLEENARLDVERELLRLLAADLPALPLTFNLQLTPVGGGLTGLQPIRGVPHQGTILYAWNIHEWDVS